jgi:hypothetical protein
MIRSGRTDLVGELWPWSIQKYHRKKVQSNYFDCDLHSFHEVSCHPWLPPSQPLLFDTVESVSEHSGLHTEQQYEILLITWYQTWIPSTRNTSLIESNFGTGLVLLAYHVTPEVHVVFTSSTLPDITVLGSTVKCYPRKQVWAAALSRQSPVISPRDLPHLITKNLPKFKRESTISVLIVYWKYAKSALMPGLGLLNH